MNPSAITLACAGVLCSTLAQGATSVSSFTFDTLPSLALPGQPVGSMAGRWTGDNLYTWFFLHTDTPGIDRDEVFEAFASPGPVVGNASRSHNYGADENALIEASGGRIAVTIQHADIQSGTGSRSVVNGNWDRQFELNPNSSVTLSGRFDYGGNFSAAPAPASLEVVESGVITFRSSWLSPLNAGTGIASEITFTARMLDFSIFQDPNNFNYSVDQSGHMSLTIRNPYDTFASGSFSIAPYVTQLSLVSAVPEPEAAAMLLLGVVVVGASAHRRRKLESAPAPRRLAMT